MKKLNIGLAALLIAGNGMNLVAMDFSAAGRGRVVPAAAGRSEARPVLGSGSERERELIGLRRSVAREVLRNPELFGLRAARSLELTRGSRYIIFPGATYIENCAPGAPNVGLEMLELSGKAVKNLSLQQTYLASESNVELFCEVLKKSASVLTTLDFTDIVCRPAMLKRLFEILVAQRVTFTALKEVIFAEVSLSDGQLVAALAKFIKTLPVVEAIDLARTGITTSTVEDVLVAAADRESMRSVDLSGNDLAGAEAAFAQAYEKHRELTITAMGLDTEAIKRARQLIRERTLIRDMADRHKTA